MTLERAEIRNHHEHFERADKRDMVFYPLTLTIFGQLGVKSRSMLKKCARYTADPSGFMAHMATVARSAMHKWYSRPPTRGGKTASVRRTQEERRTDNKRTRRKVF